MSRLLYTLPLSGISCIPIFYFIWLEYATVYNTPVVDKDGFWGTGHPTKDDDQIKLFNIDINDHKIKGFPKGNFVVAVLVAIILRKAVGDFTEYPN
uniref:Uncharacterized protein n=1 Tax=Heterorhabditis bacteriophora TaxID=37862 RepID=A0A1I7WNA5_HETBA